MHEHPLDADADLAGVGERADEAALDGPVEVGGLVDDHAGVAAELEDDPLLARPLLHPPADRRAAGEREELEALVADHPVAELAAHRQDADRAHRGPGLLDDLADRQHDERVLRRRLQDDRVARRDRRRELVGGEVEREVERADRRDRADREAPGDPHPALARGRDVERDRLADHPLRLLRAEPERDDRSIDLDEGVADRFAGLGGEELSELLAAGLDPGADVAQDRAPLVGGQVAGDLERLHGGLDRLLVLGLGRVERRARRVVRVGRVRDDQRVVGLDPGPGEEDRMRLGAGRGGHRRRSCEWARSCHSIRAPDRRPVRGPANEPVPIRVPA